MEPFGLSQPAADKFYLASRRSNAPIRLLLERVKHVDRFAELRRVHSPVGVRIVEVDDFHHTRPAKASYRLRRWVGFAALGCIQGFAHVATYGLWKPLKIRA